jgi:hypothetical protein
MAKRGKSKVTSKNKNKKAQEIFGLSFGMIFAVILIIFFVIVAIIVIQQFLCTRDCAKLGIFFSNLNERVDNAYNYEDITSTFKVDLPSQVEAVCFANLSEDPVSSVNNKGVWEKILRFDRKDNVYLYAPKKTCCDYTSYHIDHLDLKRITASENPFCIKLKKGIGSLQIEKLGGETFVRINRIEKK